MPKDLKEDRYSAPEAETPKVVSVAPDGPPEQEPETKPRGKKRLVIGAVALVAIGLAAWWGYGYWTVGRFMVNTDDAYVQADFSIIAPKISGYVASVPAVENTAVKAGDPLVILEDGDYRDALALAAAQLDAQNAAVARIDSQAAAADAGVVQAQARVEAAEAQAKATAADLARYQRLASSDVASEQRLESVQASDAAAQAAVHESEAAVLTAQANRAVITAQRSEAEAMISGLAASRDKAQRNLDSTVLRAPFDGTIGNSSVAVGDLVAVGKRLLALVPLAQVYIEANFKETQIGDLAPGTEVHLHFDAFPDRDLVGHIQGISPASGSQFSLLPPENATGNFTKVVQRLPVRIAVPQDAAAEGWLRPGLSVSASADVRTTEQPAR